MKASERASAASVPSKEYLSSSLFAARFAYLFATRSPHKRRGVGIDAPPGPFSELCACSPSQELLSNKETGQRNNGRFPKKAPQKNLTKNGKACFLPVIYRRGHSKRAPAAGPRSERSDRGRRRKRALPPVLLPLPPEDDIGRSTLRGLHH